MIKFESEKDFENFILECFEDDGLCIITDETYDDCISQFDTRSYGIPDLVFYSNDKEIGQNNEEYDVKRIQVVELKTEQIKLSHIAQIARYKTYFERAYDGFDLEMQFSLVVPEGVINNDDCCWLINSLSDISVYEYKLDPRRGIVFNESKGWRKKGADNQIALDIFGLEESKRKDF